MQISRACFLKCRRVCRPRKILIYRSHWGNSLSRANRAARETGQYNAEKYKDKRHRVHCTAVLSWRLNGTYSRERREFIGRKGIANTLREILMKEQVPEEMTKASSKAFGIVIRFCGDKTAENTAPLKRDAVYTQASRVVGSFAHWKPERSTF